MSIKYRPDIDGLRAIAVIMVVLHHFLGDPDFNGYVGVDMFFVISGFLISKIIIQDIDQKKFSLVDFYERRARRIMPALSVVLAATALAAYFLFLPQEMLAYAKSLISSVLFSSNMFFWSETGYFDAEAALKPLLHTWSLAVEEQFYILYPLLVWGCCRIMRGRLLLIMTGLMALSFTANLYFVYSGHFENSFYLLPMRAWEFLIGGILALNRLPALSLQNTKTISLAGFILLVAGFGVHFDENQFPGLYALAPCLGTAAIIYAGQYNQQAFFNRFLTRPYMQFIGKISYSLYLWHWPIYVFAAYFLLGDVKPVHIALMAITSFAAAYLSCRFIEQPWRLNKIRFTRKRVFSFTLVSLLFFTLVGIAGIKTEGARFKFDTTTLRLAETSIGGNYKPVVIEGLKDNAVGLNDDGRPSIVIWGDSHAEAISPAIQSWALKNNQNGLLIKGNSCFVSSATPARLRDSEECIKATDAALDYLINTPSVKNIVLADRWAEHLKFWYKHDYSREEAIALRVQSLQRIVDKLEKVGKRVFIMAEVPQVIAGNQNIPSILARIELYKINKDLSPLVSHYQASQQDMATVYMILEKSNPGITIRPDKFLCDVQKCILQKNGISYYYDDDHLSTEGAQSLVPMFEEKLKQE